MTIRISGDFGIFQEFADKLETIGDQGKQAILKSMAEESLDLVAEGFDKERDPYGGKWKDNVRGGEVLRDKGHLRKGWKRSRLTANEFTISPSVFYAAVHQHGKTIHAKNTRRVEYTRRNPRGRTAKGNFKRRKKGFGGYHNVVAFVKALTFRIGKQWVSKASVKIPQRMMVPSRARGLPAQWRDKYREAFDEYMRRLFN